MMRRIRLSWLLRATLAISLAAVSGTALLLACGPWIVDVVTVDRSTPAHHAAYAATGDLGVIRPRFARRYLVQAYRVISGRPPIADLMSNATYVPYSDDDPLAPRPDDTPSVDAWVAIRDRVLGAEGRALGAYIDRSREVPGGTYSYFTNCPQDAFKSAARTLEERLARYGLGSTQVRDWTRAQVDVFANCDNKTLVLPRAPTSADALVRADHAYQTAAAYFYAIDYNEAVTRFRAIAGDAASPWQPYGRYLAARALLRHATVYDNEPAQQFELFKQAEAEFREVLDDKRAAHLHASARGLLDYLELRRSPDVRRRALAKMLATSPAVTPQQLYDYRFLMDKALGDTVDIEFDAIAGRAALVANDDLTDWIVTTQGKGDAALARALTQWQDTRAPHWLISVLWKLPATDASAPTALAAAAAIERRSPAYATVAFLHARLLAARGDRAEARRLLATLPDQPQPGFPAESVNLLRALRLQLADTFDEFLTNAMRTASDPSLTQPVFDEDAGLVFTRHMPLERLIEAARSTVLPMRLRARLAGAALARAIVLERPAVAREAATTLRDVAPNLRAALDAYLKAAEDDRQRAGLLLLLRTPGLHAHVLGMDDTITYDVNEPAQVFDHPLRRNWWCTTRDGHIGYEYGHDSGGVLEWLHPDAPAGPPQFLSATEREAAAREYAALVALGPAQHYLGDEAIEWTRTQPTDARAAEALALTVEGGRWSCSVSATSRRAFETLHRVFPRSEWARRTKYWYAGHQ